MLTSGLAIIAWGSITLIPNFNSSETPAWIWHPLSVYGHLPKILTARSNRSPSPDPLHLRTSSQLSWPCAEVHLSSSPEEIHSSQAGFSKPPGLRGKPLQPFPFRTLPWNAADEAC